MRVIAGARGRRAKPKRSKTKDGRGKRKWGELL